MAFDIDYPAIVAYRPLGYYADASDWLEWRLTYHGGREFRDRYLRQLSDRETRPDFERRRDVTPIPTFAKREINRVKNSLFQRFGDVIRRSGSKAYQDAVAGVGKGIDNKGSSMNAYLGECVLPELLVMGKVGILIDAPRVTGPTKADVPDGFRPYVYDFAIEQIPFIIKADAESPSDFQAVMLTEYHQSADWRTGKTTQSTSHRFYWIDPDTGKVNLQLLDKDAKPSEAVIKLDLTAIPFVMLDIKQSLIQDVCSHQRALLNLISSDTAYALDSNFPFLVKQRGNAQDGSHLAGDGDAKTVAVGVTKGMNYDKGANQPAFIAPPVEPMKASLELRRELKDEVRELVMGIVEDLGDGSIEAGLSFIGLCLERGENRIGDHFTAYETADDAARERPLVKYPEWWALTPPKDRIEEASDLVDLAYKVPSRLGKKELNKLVVDKLLRGRVDETKLDAIKSEIDKAPYCTSDPAIIIPAKKEGLISTETGSLALGGDEQEAERAKKDQADRAKEIALAQADAAAARGNPAGSVTPAKSAADEKAGSKPGDKLGGGNNDE